MYFPSCKRLRNIPSDNDSTRMKILDAYGKSCIDYINRE